MAYIGFNSINFKTTQNAPPTIYKIYLLISSHLINYLSSYNQSITIIIMDCILQSNLSIIFPNINTDKLQSTKTYQKARQIKELQRQTRKNTRKEDKEKIESQKKKESKKRLSENFYFFVFAFIKNHSRIIKILARAKRATIYQQQYPFHNL